MRKHYTRACNFYHWRIAKRLISSKKALPLNGKNDLAFDTIEILTRKKNTIKSELLHFKNINRLNNKIKKIVKKDI